MATSDFVWFPHYSQTVYWAYKVRYRHLLHDLLAVQPIRGWQNTVMIRRKLSRSGLLQFDLNFFFRVQIKQGEEILTDSGNIYNTALTGGRLGMFVFGQHDVIWSRLEARCSDRYVTSVTVISWFPRRSKRKDTS